MIRHCALLGLASFALAFAADPARADVVFSDSDFNLADYEVATYANAGFTTSFFQGFGVGGVGTSLATSYEKFGPSSPAPRFHALNSNFVYDPSVDGAILSIDIAFDAFISLYHNLSVVNVAGGSAQARIMAEQNGKLYIAARNVFTGLPFESWYNVASTTFLANEFSLFDPANPFAPRTLRELDFTGGPITFGVEIAHFGVLTNGGPSTGRVQSTMAMDNLSLTLRTADPQTAVPEPATWALMIAGFGLAGAALRRSRQAATALS